MQRSSFHGGGVTLQPPRPIFAAQPTVSLSPFITRCQRDSIDDRRDSHNHASSQSTPARPRFRKTRSGTDQRSPFRAPLPTRPGASPPPAPTSPSSPPYSERKHIPNSGGTSTTHSGRFRHTSGRLKHHNGPAGGSPRSLQPRRWLSELARQVKDILPKDYSIEEDVDPEIATKILALVPRAYVPAGVSNPNGGWEPAAGEQTQHSSVKVSPVEVAESPASAPDSLPTVATKEADISSESALESSSAVAVLQPQESALPTAEREEEASSGDDSKSVAPPQTVYDAELAAILQHYKSTQCDELKQPPTHSKRDNGSRGGGSPGNSNDSSNGNGNIGGAPSEGRASSPARDSAKRFQPQQQFSSPSASRHQIAEGSLMLLLRLVADAIGPRPVLLLYRILDGADYPTRAPKFVASVANLLVKREFSEGAIEVVRRSVLGIGRQASTGSGIADAWAALSRSDRPDLISDLIQDMKSSGLTPDADAYLCFLRVHSYAKDAVSALAVFEEMRRQGVERSSAVYAALTGAAVGARDVDLAFKALFWAEKEAEMDPNLNLAPLWRELLAMATTPEADNGLRERLVARMAKQGRQVSCEALNRVVCNACDAGHVLGAISLFESLRDRGLVAGIPVAGIASSLSTSSSSPTLSISGLEYEQVLPSEDFPDTSAGVKNADAASSDSEDAVSVADIIVSDSDSDIETEPEGYLSTDDGFFSTPAAALLLYTSLILGAHKARKDDIMKQLYGWLHQDGLIPNRPIMTRMVASLPYTDDPAGAMELYEYIRDLGIPMDGFMYGHVIAALLVGAQNKQWWETALLLTHRMHMAVAASHDTSVETSLAVTAGRNGWVPQLLQLYNLMLQDGVMPRGITWNAFITAAVRCNRPDLGFAFAAAMRKMGCLLDTATHSALISCSAGLRDFDAAQRQWDTMLRDGIMPDCIACTSFMWACLCSGKPQAAVDFFETWRREGKPLGWDIGLAAGKRTADATNIPTPNTFSEMCTALLKGGRWDLSRAALQHQRWIKTQGEDPRNFSLEQLRAKAAIRGGRWAQASALADAAIKVPPPAVPPTPDSVSLSFAITAYSQLNDTPRALQLADELASSDLPLHSNMFSTALDGCAAAGALDAALKLLRRARAAGLRPDQAAYGAAITAAAPRGSVSAALMILEWMIEDGVTPNIIVLNSILSVCTSAGDAEAALAVFWRMEGEFGVAPDAICFATVCEVLAKAGRWGDAVRAMLVSEATEAYTETSRGPPLLKICALDPPASSLDLHGLSVAAASAVLRAWLLAMARSPAVASGALDDISIVIITGKGRNSKEGVPRLRPSVEELLKTGLGVHLAFSVPSANPGCLEINGAAFRQGLAQPGIDFGFGGQKETDALWKLVVGHVPVTYDTLPKPRKSTSLEKPKQGK